MYFGWNPINYRRNNPEVNCQAGNRISGTNLWTEIIIAEDLNTVLHEILGSKMHEYQAFQLQNYYIESLLAAECDLKISYRLEYTYVHLCYNIHALYQNSFEILSTPKALIQACNHDIYHLQFLM